MMLIACCNCNGDVDDHEDDDYFPGSSYKLSFRDIGLLFGWKKAFCFCIRYHLAIHSPLAKPLCLVSFA